MEKLALKLGELRELEGYLMAFVKFKDGNVIGCNGTLAHTEDWLLDFGPKEKWAEIIDSLKEQGGYCDCEVLLNVIGKLHDT